MMWELWSCAAAPPLAGCIPGLPRIRWRETLGLVADVKTKLQSQATELRSEMGQALTALRRPPSESKED